MAAAPVGAVSTEYPSSTKFCRSESAIIGSSSTTRIRTSLFSTFFSSLEIAAPWGMMITLLYVIAKMNSIRKGKLNCKFLVYELYCSAVGFDDPGRQSQFDLFAAGK